MFKLVVLFAAAIPIFLFLRAVVFRRSTAMQQAFASLDRQIKFLSGVILILVGCGIVYSVGKLISSFWN
jgi:hypothetical protein